MTSLKKRTNPETDASAQALAEITAVDARGRAYVRVVGSDEAAVIARSALAVLPAPGSAKDLVGRLVLVAFEAGDRAFPIVVGFVHDELLPQPCATVARLDGGEQREVLIDGRRLVLDAAREIVLRCGKSLIVLKRDGKIVIRGEQLVSRATGTHRIKGGTISLN